MAFYRPETSFEGHLAYLKASPLGTGLKTYKGEPVLHAWGQRFYLSEGRISAAARAIDVTVFEYLLPADPTIWSD